MAEWIKNKTQFFFVHENLTSEMMMTGTEHPAREVGWYPHSSKGSKAG